MNKKIILLPIMVLSLIFSATTYAQYDNTNKGGTQCKYKQYKEKMKKIENKLNLTDEQKKQIELIKSDTKSQLKSIRKQMKSLKKQMKDLVMSEKMDEDKMNALINEKKELVGEKLKITLKAKNKWYNILTSEQKAKFSSMREKWKQEKMKDNSDDNSDHEGEND